MKGMLKGFAALALATALFTSTASAQTPIQFGIGGGVTVPLSDFGDQAELGFHGLATVQFQPASLPVGVQIDGMYHRNSFKDNVGEDGNFQTISGTVNAVYTFTTAEESRFHPYLVGGVGAYNFKANFEDFDDESETKFGANAGAGFTMMMGGASVFIEGRFHNIFTSGSDVNMVPVTIGVKFGG